MTLLADVKQILDRLAPRGWGELFNKHGLDITVSPTKLQDELTRPLIGIDRTLPGFEEFSLDGIRAIEPGIPGRSLLYHALASSDVNPLPSKRQPVPDDYPTFEDLDAVENLIYSLAQRTLSSFHNPVVAVFAYEYRDAALSPHRKHADLGFSRTGVARVGTEAFRPDPATRSFDPRPSGGDRGFAAIPARYAAFLAEYRAPSPEDAVLRSVPLDSGLSFLFPLHKLFAGKECLFKPDGSPLNLNGLQFVEAHINEKLRRIHLAAADNPGSVPPLPQFNINDAPFVRTGGLVRLQKVGASVLVVPVPNKIAHTATQPVNGANELVRFTVPKAASANRFWSSLQIRATNKGRAAPEYANIRQLAVQQANGRFKLEDLNQRKEAGTPPANQFDAVLSAGGYEAAHFIDGTCDGALSVTAPAALSLPTFPAFSLVAAVDYFPLVDQVEIEEWVEKKTGASVGLGDPSFQFNQGGPEPLSDGRFEVTSAGNLRLSQNIPNTTLNDPAANSVPAFSPTEAANLTATAVVGRAATAGAQGRSVTPRRGTGWLPDGAADVFAPGWDVSRHVVNGRGNYVSYGLGSPFPEDSKLCAALNSFWPAAAPDSSRTYGFSPKSRSLLATAIPLLDGELGYHPEHPRVTAGEATSNHGWDGDFGPFLATDAGQSFVNASEPSRADETRAAFDGLLGFSSLDQVSSSELIQRMEDLDFCRTAVLQTIHSRDPWLVSVERVRDWSTWTSAVWPRLNAGLIGDGYIFVFAEVDPAPQPVGDPPLRRRFQVRHTVRIQLSQKVAFYTVDNGAVKKVNR